MYVLCDTSSVLMLLRIAPDIFVDERFECVTVKVVHDEIVGTTRFKSKYPWTEGGNVPSAKIAFINEAAFYLSFLPQKTIKFIVLRRDYHKKREETLAEYYMRTNRHLIGDVKILEINMGRGTVKEVA